MGGGRICLEDAAAQAAFGEALVSIADVRGVLAEVQKDLLDRAGEVLAASTAALTAAVVDEAPGAITHLLVYLPTVLDPKAPEAKRDRKRVVEGKSVSVRVDLGGRRIIKQKTSACQDGLLCRMTLC